MGSGGMVGPALSVGRSPLSMGRERDGVGEEELERLVRREGTLDLPRGRRPRDVRIRRRCSLVWRRLRELRPRVAQLIL